MNRRTFLKSAGLGLAAMTARGAFAAAAVPAAAAPPRPNILFLFPDQHRPDWTSLNPALPDLTPNLKALAAEGVRFSCALTPSPLCAPARACLASGKEYARSRVPNNAAAYPLDQPTFYSLLKAAGYRVLGCGKFDLDKPGNSWGADGQHRRTGKPSLLEAWGFTAGCDNEGKHDGENVYKKSRDRAGPYFRYLEEKGLVEAHVKNFRTFDHDYEGPSLVPDEAYADNWIARNGLALVAAVPRGEPWFLQVNFNGPHSPMDITKSMYEKWKGASFPPPRPAGPAAKAGKKKGGGGGEGAGSPKSRRNYAAMIANIDAWTARFREALRERGDLGRTLIVYSSDHGEMLGDRGLGGKTRPWQASVGVPLVVAGPGVRAGVTCPQPVTTLDLAATFLDYAGVARPAEMDSRSLRPFLEGRGDLPRGAVTSALGDWRVVVEGTHKLIAGEPGAGPSGYFLYDLAKDPHEETDLADRLPDVVRRLAALLPAG